MFLRIPPIPIQSILCMYIFPGITCLQCHCNQFQGWNFRHDGSVCHPVTFQVWRPTDCTNTIFTLIGQNVLSDTWCTCDRLDEYSTVTTNVPATDTATRNDVTSAEVTSIYVTAAGVTVTDATATVVTVTDATVADVTATDATATDVTVTDATPTVITVTDVTATDAAVASTDVTSTHVTSTQVTWTQVTSTDMPMTDVSISVPVSHQIPVQPGDVVGWYVCNAFWFDLLLPSVALSFPRFFVSIVVSFPFLLYFPFRLFLISPALFFRLSYFRVLLSISVRSVYLVLLVFTQ